MESKHLVIAGIVGMFWVGAAGFAWMKMRSTEEEVRESRETAGEGKSPAPPPGPPRPKKSLRLIEAENPRPGEEAKALATVKAILAAPESEDEAKRAREILPFRYRDVFIRARIDGDLARLEAIVAEAPGNCPGSPQVEEIVRIWAEARSDWFTHALDRGDEATAARLFDATLREGGRFSNRVPQWLAGKWKTAHERGDEKAADDVLRLVGRLFVEHGLGHSLSQPLGDAFGRDGCLARGDAFRDSGELGAALVCYEAARFMTGRDENGVTVADERYAAQHAELTDRVLAVQLEAARRAVANAASHSEALERAESLAAEVHRVSWDQLTDRLPEEVLAVHRERAIESYRIQIASRTERARRALAGGELEEAERLCRHVLETDALFFFAALARDPAYDPWAQVPDGIEARIDAAAPGADRERRLAELRRLMDRSRFRIAFAETAPARRLAGEVAVRQGLADLPKDRERALDRLRTVLRDHPGTDPAAAAAEGLRSAIRSAESSSDFAALVDLAGFYVAEVGPPGSGEPFRDELRRCLEGAASHFGSREPLERVFLLSLLADLFAGEPAGDAHRREAFRLGMEFVERAEVAAERDEAALGPSGLAGLSVLPIENGTRFHVLAFFRGPVEFFVRLNPYRRGTIVLPDGKWTTAVLVTSREIKPYRGEAELRGVVQPHAYYIGKEGTSDAPAEVRSIGDFRLLWRPEGAGEFAVDAETGLARKEE